MKQLSYKKVLNVNEFLSCQRAIKVESIVVVLGGAGGEVIVVQKDAECETIVVVQEKG